MPSLKQGSIVWASVQCRYTGEWKDRPAIIATATDEIADAAEIVAVAVSHSATEASKPWPEWYVPLPYHREGRVHTKLKKETVALCDWVFALRHDHIRDFIGDYVKPQDYWMKVPTP